MWKVEWDDRARKELRSLSNDLQTTILSYLKERIATNQDPKRFGKPLVGNKKGLWRYRIGDYRLVCFIENKVCIVLVLAIGHRSSVYR